MDVALSYFPIEQQPMRIRSELDENTATSQWEGDVISWEYYAKELDEG